ncbi:MAG TPA: DUF3592 domain-containing protein [Nocardioides sp.]|nr:DUF3592 domain-containing protein [Nocardioides sp.]
MGIPMLPVLVAGVLALLGGAFFVWRGRLHGLADREFVRRSVTATAEVTDVVAVDVNRMDGDFQRVWHPVVRFALPDGQVVEARAMYGSSPQPTRAGRREVVRYDPADPGRVALAQGLASPGRLGSLQVILGVGLIGVGLMTVMVWAFLALVLRVPA